MFAYVFVSILSDKIRRLFEYNYQYWTGSETSAVTGPAVTLTDTADELNNIGYVGCGVDIITIIVVLSRWGNVFFFF